MDNQGEAPIRTLLFLGFFYCETGRYPGARVSINIKVSDTPQEISPLSRRCHSDKSSTLYISVYITQMTQYTGRPPGTIKLPGTQHPTFLHTLICQDTGQPHVNHSHLTIQYFVTAHTPQLNYYLSFVHTQPMLAQLRFYQHCVLPCVSRTPLYSRGPHAPQLINSNSFQHTKPMLAQCRFFQHCVSTPPPYSIGFVLHCVSTMNMKAPSTPGSVSNIVKLTTQKSSPDRSIKPGLKKKAKGVVFNATETPQRDLTGAPAVTPTSPPKLQHRQAGDGVWADDQCQ